MALSRTAADSSFRAATFSARGPRARVELSPDPTVERAENGAFPGRSQRWPSDSTLVFRHLKLRIKRINPSCFAYFADRYPCLASCVTTFFTATAARGRNRADCGIVILQCLTQTAFVRRATEFFDQRFVYAACTIGAAYALIIAGLGSWLGKEAAGVAGVALTALATAIFKQFETLRFKRIAEREERTVSIPRLNMPYLLLLVFAMAGIQYLVGMLFGAILARLDGLR